MFQLFRKSLTPLNPPLIIGALGGSGTRAVTNIVGRCGWWMGSNISATTQDSIPVRLFLNRWFERLIEDPELDVRIRERAENDFRKAIKKHNRGMPDANSLWGWKNPRSMWLLPFYLGIYPDLKFIHLVRDARDMALSKNHFLLNMHGDHLVGPSWRNKPEEAQITLWARGNMRAADAAAGCKPGNYLLLRYEDMCLRKEEALAGILKFLDIKDRPLDDLEMEIKPSSGIGRSISSPLIDVGKLDPIVSAALSRFGYA